MTDPYEYTDFDRARDAVANSDWMDTGYVDPFTIAEGYVFFDRVIRKVKADLLKEIVREVRGIPCWYPDNDQMGGEFDLDGESHRRFVLDTLLAYGTERGIDA